MKFTKAKYPVAFRGGRLRSLWPDSRRVVLSGCFKVRHELYIWWACWQFHFIWWSWK